MLLEKSQELIELSQRKKSLQNFAANLQIIQTRQKQITDAVVTIQPLVEALKAFRQRGINNIDLTHKAESVLNFILNAEDNLQKNSDWILDNKNFKGSFLKSNIDSLKTTLEQQLSEAWKSYRDQQMPSTKNEILNLLAKVEAFKHTVLQIQIIDGEIKNVTYPKNNAEFAIYERKIEQLKYYWNTLSSDEVPEAVLHFLRAAANQGASLNLLTPEVQDWINQHGISDSLKIRLI
ncbi:MULTISPECIES: hypothetical protein [unclassified Tolypothrix]|uniref:hypothetical protein n=1 Tax=unclassified Tolypothrix TaxID=2649714 RepID=UPI0005EAC48A|nr:MULTISPECIES: hypothetical protein [unclassified Tolypothrix]BAY89820.1 hypothetical protein NIES3275_18230 [Microchaete diplosiphon NIES-3275]EKF00749.1 hypothetical protein FDUTEX481_08560 [Tolypothrix sp. PCC 7601]MBE9082914.1 hypothetical protein [Tolypothrix sp. LEGE 11397]UYD24074.1 hypothetical protein HGR01_21530 [Tolypothrix sp. PCC 7712]UYD33696.1 hypothetical protein HG267_33200 [Tolypothrix sp. PCC 7601]